MVGDTHSRFFKMTVKNRAALDNIRMNFAGRASHTLTVSSLFVNDFSGTTLYVDRPADPRTDFILLA